MNSNIKFNKSSREAILQGIDIIANAVSVTLGGAGRNVIIDHSSYPSPHITKDGVTVARSIFLKDPIQQAGVRLIKNVANTAVEASGDGTTTATVIAQSIAQKGINNIGGKVNPIGVFKGIEIAHKEVVKELSKLSKSVEYGSEDLINIATISANNDREIGEIVAEAVTLAGNHGSITVEESDSVITSMEHVDGIIVDSGWLSPYFVNNPSTRSVDYENPLIFITNKKITLLSEMMTLIQISNTSGRPLVIIAEEVIGEALQTLIVNSMKQRINITAIEAPSFGNLSKEYLTDIATVTGATLVSQESGIDLNEVTSDMLGEAKKIIIGQTETQIIDGGGTQTSINALISEIEEAIKITDKGYHLDFLRNRLAKVSGGVVVLSVGAPTSVELKERRDRFDDAIGATRAAMSNGVICGGGIPLYRLGSSLDIKSDNESEQIGINILLSAIKIPAMTILINSGLNGHDSANILDSIDKEDTVYDVVNKRLGNSYDLGILDPLKVTLSSLESAVSIGGILLTTEVTIVNED